MFDDSIEHLYARFQIHGPLKAQNGQLYTKAKAECCDSF